MPDKPTTRRKLQPLLWQERIDRGVCPRCGAEPVAGHHLCARHLADKRSVADR